LLVIRRDAAYKINNRQQANISQPVSGLPANLQSSSLLEDGEVKPDQLSDNGSAQPLDLDESQLVRSSVPPFSETTRLAKVDIVEALITDLHSLEPDNRRKAIWELGQRGDSRAIQPLVDLLMDSDSAQRSLILAAVSEIGVRSLKPLTRGLMLSIQDDSPDVRKNAIRDVTRLCDVVTQVSQLLQYAASDTDPEVRDTAQWALGQLSRIRSLPDESSAGSSTAATSRSEEASSDGA
jgi:HEAT repeat protein